MPAETVLLFHNFFYLYVIHLRCVQYSTSKE